MRMYLFDVKRIQKRKEIGLCLFIPIMLRIIVEFLKMCLRVVVDCGQRT